MSVIVECSIPAEDFGLGRALQEGDYTRIELEQIVSAGEAFVPFFWVNNADTETFETALRSAEPVVNVRLLDELDGQALYRVEWGPEIDGFLRSVLDRDAVILEAVGTGGRWHFELRFPGGDVLSRFQADCRNRGIALDVQRIAKVVNRERDTETWGLTSAQREILVTAVEAGYFSIPRKKNLAQIAEMLDISDQSASERLRRGIATLVTATLLTASETE